MASTTVSRFRELGKKIVAVGRNYKYDVFFVKTLLISVLHLNTRPPTFPTGHNLACLESRVRSEKSWDLHLHVRSFSTNGLWQKSVVKWAIQSAFNIFTKACAYK